MIEEHLGKGIDALFAQGVLGVLLVGAIGFIVVLVRQNRDLQNARVEDIKNNSADTIRALSGANASAAALAVATTDNNRLLQTVVDATKPLPAGIETLSKALDRNAGKIDAVHDELRDRR